MKKCSYCLRDSKKSLDHTKKCSCLLCLNCLLFLQSSNHLICPFHLNEIIIKPKNLSSYQKSQKSCLTIQDSPRHALDKLFSEIKELIKLHESSHFNIKTLFYAKKSLEIREKTSLVLNGLKSEKEMINLLKALDLFTYLNIRFDFLNYFDFNTRCVLEISNLMHIGLLRERNLIPDPSNCMFFGKNLTCTLTGSGISTEKFMVSSGDNFEITALGVGLSVGKNSSIFYMFYEISENKSVISQEFITKEFINTRSSLTGEIPLKRPILLKKGAEYKICYQFSSENFYTLASHDREFYFGELVLKNINEGCTFVTLYLRLNRRTLV